VRLICHEDNKGLAASRNTGIRAAQGRYIAFLDGDDLWVLPAFVEKHVAVLESDSHIGVTFSRYAYMNEQGEPTGDAWHTRVREPTLRQMLHRNRAGSSFLARRACLFEAGLFNETLRSCEDYELWLRVLHNTPYSMRLVPDIFYLYRLHNASLTMDFSGFLRAADAVAAMVLRAMPDIPEKDVRRGQSESYRIASRRALANGRVELARNQIMAALRLYPPLPFVSLRAGLLLTLIMMQSAAPETWRRRLYGFAAVCWRTTSQLRGRLLR